MADKKISDLNPAGSAATDDVYEIENSGGNSRKVTGAQLATMVKTANNSIIRLDILTAPVNSAATTSEQFLYTYTLPANTLSSNGQSIRIFFAGQLAATTRSRNIKIYFGASSQTVVTTAASSDVLFRCETIITRTGASSQIGNSVKLISPNNAATPTHFNSRLAPAETLSGTVDIKISCTTGATGTANDVILEQVIIELIP